MFINYFILYESVFPFVSLLLFTILYLNSFGHSRSFPSVRAASSLKRAYYLGAFHHRKHLNISGKAMPPLYVIISGCAPSQLTFRGLAMSRMDAAALLEVCLTGHPY